MTTKKLNAQQARWAGFLSQFYFLIRYRPGRENTLADALSQPTTEVQRKDEYCQQILLKPDSVERPSETEAMVSDIEPTLQIVDQLLKVNRKSTVEEHCEKAQKEVDG